MTDTLKNSIRALADTFATSVLAAIRGASLGEILAEGGSGKRGPGRPRKAPGDSTAGNPGPRKGKGGRLARRSPEDIERLVGLVVGALKSQKAGMRSEQLQKVLKLSKKEIVRPLAEALTAKKITKKGQKRSTTYFAT